MFRRVPLLLAVCCLVAVSCGGSSNDAPTSNEGGETTDVPDTSTNDTANTGGCTLSEEDAIAQARAVAIADDMGDIADGFMDSAGIVTAANIREDFWEVTFSTDGGAIEIYLTCGGELASVGTNGDALP